MPLRIRQAARRLWKQPGFFWAICLTLGLGIGCATVGFSVVETLVLRPLPLVDADELVILTEFDGDGRSRGGSLAALEVWRGRTGAFSGVAGYRLHDINLSGPDRPEALMAASVTGNFFPVLRETAFLGRLFGDDEAEAGAPVVVLSYRFWNRRFGARQDVIGEQLPLGDRQYSIVGVLPNSYRFLEYVPDVVIPLPSRPQSVEASLRSNLPVVVARLQAGVGQPQALAIAKEAAEELRRRFPAARSGWGADLEDLHSRWMGRTHRPALLLFAAVALLLLVSCSNAAGLVLARGMRLRQEIAVRSALGATRRAIAKDLLAEASLFSLFGCVIGLALAALGLQALVVVLPAEVIRLVPGEAASFRLNPLAASFAALTGALTAVVCSFSPMLHKTTVTLADALKSSGRSSPGSDHRGRAFLLAGQVAFSVILLVAGGLLLKGYWEARQTEVGFDTQGLLTMWMGLPESRYQDEARRALLYGRVIEELEALPEVEAATAVDLLPSHEDQGMSPFAGPQTSTIDMSQWPQAATRRVAENYFAAMRIPLKQGRPFDSRDNSDGALAAVVSSSLAVSQYGGEAIGRQIRLRDASGDAAVAQIVGIAADVLSPLQRGSTDVVYLPIGQAPPTMIYFLARTNRPEEVSGLAREILWKTDPTQPLDGPWMMNALLTDRLAVHRLSSSIVLGFAVSALSLAAFGIYSVVAYLVSSRRKEIGIRLAVGASPAGIMRLILARGLGLVAWGLVAGLAAMLALSFVLQPFLLDVSQFDLSIYAGVAALVMAVAAAACAVPARSASKLDPISTLRLD